MTSAEETTTYPVEVSIDDWRWIDTSMDNYVHVAFFGAVPDLDPSMAPRVIRLGKSVHRAGADQIRERPPPVLRLSGAQWSLVISALRMWAEADDSIDEPERAARSRALAAAIEGRLAGQDWSFGL